MDGKRIRKRREKIRKIISYNIEVLMNEGDFGEAYIHLGQSTLDEGSKVKLHAKKMRVKVVGDFKLEAGTRSAYSSVEQDSGSFDIGVSLSGVKLGFSASEYEGESGKIERIKAEIGGDDLELIVGGKLEIEGAEIGGKKVKVEALEVLVEDVLDKVYADSSGSSIGMGINIGWSGGVMPYGSFSYVDDVKKSGIVKFISGITGSKVEVVTKKLIYNVAQITESKELKIVADKIEYTEKEEGYENDRGRKVSMSADVSPKGEMRLGGGLYYRKDGDVISGYMSSELFNMVRDLFKEDVVHDNTNAIESQERENRLPLKDQGWEEMNVEKDEWVTKIYGGKASQKELEEFIARNPHIIKRGVIRDENGNIVHLDIRPGEKILVPKQVYEEHIARRAEQQQQNTKLAIEPYSIPIVSNSGEHVPDIKSQEQKIKDNKKLSVNQKLVFANAGYEKTPQDGIKILEEGGEQNSKILKVFHNKEQGSNSVIIANPEGILSYNVAGTHPPSLDQNDIKETFKDLETDFYIATGQLKGDLKYRVEEVIKNIIIFNQETGNNQPLILNGHSAGAPPAFFAKQFRPDLIKSVNMIESPGLYNMAVKFYGGDTTKAQKAYQNVEIYNGNRNLINSHGDHPPGKLIHHIQSDFHKVDEIKQSYDRFGSTLILGRCHMNVACTYKNGEYIINRSPPTTKLKIAEYYGVSEDHVEVVPVTTSETAKQKNPNPTQLYHSFRITGITGEKDE